MRYAIISDIHANWQAWTAVLEDVQANQADLIICLGDIVGYGPRPEEVLTSVRQHTSNIVMGNHDAAACGLLDSSIFNEHAREVVHWTAKQLSDESLSFLRQIPLSLDSEDILFVHAEVQDPGRFGYIESEESALHQFMFTEANIVFVGHTHKPLAYAYNSDSIKELPDTDFQLAPGHRYMVNAGSAGEPRFSDDIRARYVLYDSTRRAVHFRRVAFDVEAYRNDLVQVGLNIQPYFLSAVDHEAARGNDLLDQHNDRMMMVPDKPIEASHKTQSVVTTAPENLPPAPPKNTSGPQLTTAPLPPQPASPPQQNTNIGFIVFLLSVMLVAFGIALLILFR